MSGLIQWLQSQGQQHPSNVQSPEQARLAQIAQSAQLQSLAARAQGGAALPAGQPQDPNAFRQAIHNIWQRYGGQQPQAQPQAPGGYSARFAGLTPMPSGASGGGLPPLSAPPRPQGQGNLNPSSIRVDFHAPPEPE